MQESKWEASLLWGGQSKAERRENLGRVIEGQMQKLGYTDRAVAERVEVTAQAIRQYRLGQRLPRPNVLQRLADILQIDAATMSTPTQRTATHLREPSPETDVLSGQGSPPGLRAIRIGVSQHWNSAVFASFGPLFLERGIKPIFVPINSRLESVHSALDQNVDVVIHYQYLVQYDEMLKPITPEPISTDDSQRQLAADGKALQARRADNRYLGLQSDYPLFVFHGIHLFANKAHLLNLWNQLGIPRDELDELNEYLSEYALLPYTHPRYEELVKAALEASTIDVLEGSHYQYAAQNLYARHGLKFEQYRPDGRSGETDRDPLRLFREEESGIDLYMGVNRDWLLLRKELDADGDSRFIILVLPELIDVRPMACLIYRRGNSQLYEGALQDLAHVWFTGIQQILAWTVDIEDQTQPLKTNPNIDVIIALSHLEAVSRITNRFTGDFEVALEAEELKGWFKRMAKHHTFYPSLEAAKAQQALSQTQELGMAKLLKKYTPQTDWKERAEEYR